MSRLPFTRHEIEWVNHPAKFDDVIVKHGIMGWVLPYHTARFLLKYDPRKLPVVQTAVVFTPSNVAVWELTGPQSFCDKLVFAMERPDEDFYRSMSIARIKRGHRAFTPSPLPSSPFL